MPQVHLPSSLRRLAGGQDSHRVDGATAAEALTRLETLHPELAGWVLDERGTLRQHVALFRGDRQVGPDATLSPDDRLYVVQAISGGNLAAVEATPDEMTLLAPVLDADEVELEILVGTRKGLFVLRGPRGGELAVSDRRFSGQEVELAIRDPRSGRCFASVTHGQFGPRIFWSDDPTAPDEEWEQAAGPAFPEDTEAAVSRIWVIEPGEGPGELWAGVAPAALFHSTDDGASWELNRALWDLPSRPDWTGGAGGLCLHSICPWPGDPERLAVGISAAGVWLTEDGGASWSWGGAGLVPRYIPEEAREGATALCVHSMKRSPVAPETLYIQFHGGVYRSDDAGRSWSEIGGSLPADFGFPLVVDPRDPDRAFVVPLVADYDRVTPDGEVRVFETRDRGESWRPLGAGLPSAGAYLTVLRQAFSGDGGDPLGLYFGATSGELFGSVDGGATWGTLAPHLPPILSVRATCETR